MDDEGYFFKHYRSLIYTKVMFGLPTSLKGLEAFTYDEVLSSSSKIFEAEFVTFLYLP